MGKDNTSDQVTSSVAEDNRVAVGDGGKSFIARDDSVINVTADEAFNLVKEVVSDYADIVKIKDSAATGLAYEAFSMASSSTTGDTKELVEKAIKFGLPAVAIFFAAKALK